MRVKILRFVGIGGREFEREKDRERFKICRNI